MHSLYYWLNAQSKSLYILSLSKYIKRGSLKFPGPSLSCAHLRGIGAIVAGGKQMKTPAGDRIRNKLQDEFLTSHGFVHLDLDQPGQLDVREAYEKKRGRILENSARKLARMGRDRLSFRSGTFCWTLQLCHWNLEPSAWLTNRYKPIIAVVHALARYSCCTLPRNWTS